MNFLSLSGVHTPRCRTIKEMGNGTCVYMKRMMTFREKWFGSLCLHPLSLFKFCEIEEFFTAR